MKKHLLFYFFLLGLPHLYAQTLVKDCKTQQPISNAIIYNAVNNQVVGTTNSDGKIDLPPTIQDIVLVHPEYGSIPTINQAVICIDELLKPIIIEVKKDATEELLAILKNSFEQYKTGSPDQQYYQYYGTVYENNTLGAVVVKEEGYCKKMTYYNVDFYLSDRLAPYYKKIDLGATGILSKKQVDYFFFNSTSKFKAFLKRIKKLQVEKVNQDFYVYSKTWDNYWLFEIDTAQNRVRKFVDTSVQANFIEYGEKILFKTKRRLIHRLVEVNYDWINDHLQQKLALYDLYEFEGLDTKLAKYVTVHTVDSKEINSKNTYSFNQYLNLKVDRAMEIEELADKLEKKNRKR